MIYLIIALAFLFALSKHERDEIAHHKDRCFFPNWKWYIENRWRTKSWFIKNPFSFLLDGWHFWEYVNNFVAYLAIALLLDMWYLAFLFLVLGGGLHSLLDGSLLRKKQYNN